MKPRLPLIRTRLEEHWMCKSTAVLCASAELAKLAADILCHQSSRLFTFSRRRFMAYVERVHGAHVEPLDPPG